ncbi:MAG TPA: virulence factor SrfC family protein, partial [Rhodopila sp.]
MSATTDIVDHIVLRSGQIAEATETAAQWVEQHGAALRQDGEALARELRRHGRRALRLHQAARRPMCVAVFGASQAGKSYLVSRLAVAPGGRLAGRFGDATFDFLMDINPPGGQEATGLVTRFTTHPPAAPISTPVTLRLLSQLDLVKILANTYLEDFDIEIVPPDAVALERLFATATAAARPAPVDAFTTGDVEDLGEYFERHFRHHTLLAQLNSVGYWPRVAELAPRLTVADRAALFAPLWGGTPRFTALFRQLADALATLGFSEIAYCGTDALVPRETSIIDVRQLFGIGDEKAVSVSVVTPSGGRAVLDRAVLAALVAELTFPLAEQPWPFFDTTDLLDFPGARTRETITDIDRFLAQPEKLGRAFLRGKVAYLFQRYNAEQEITGMLLCVGPSNQEVQTLPRMVQDWIQLTLGDTPAKREAQRNSLFLVLTKFDAEFEDKAGEEPSTGQRWTARLQASLLDFFGKAYDWPTEWLPGRPFDNLFWLRNPAISFGAVFDYGPPLAPGVPAPEIGVAPRASAAVAVKRSAYLANSLVRRHIAEPEAAWDCALTPNDGGITRLAGALGPVCDPAL